MSERVTERAEVSERQRQETDATREQMKHERNTRSEAIEGFESERGKRQGETQKGRVVSRMKLDIETTGEASPDEETVLCGITLRV